MVVLTHIVFGGIVLLAAAFQIISNKGGRWHQWVGQLYFFSWLMMLMTGWYFDVLHITCIGLFGLYYVLLGTRLGALRHKPFTWFEKGLVLAGYALAAYILYTAYRYGVRQFWFMTISLGLLGVYLFVTSILDTGKHIFRKPLVNLNLGRYTWQFEHLTKMYVSLTAALIAFVMVQDYLQDVWLNFLVPLLSGLILTSTSYFFFLKKFKLRTYKTNKTRVEKLNMMIKTGGEYKHIRPN